MGALNDEPMNRVCGYNAADFTAEFANGCHSITPLDGSPTATNLLSQNSAYFVKMLSNLNITLVLFHKEASCSDCGNEVTDYKGLAEIRLP